MNRDQHVSINFSYFINKILHRCIVTYLYYSAEITEQGQTDSQEPQSMQVSLISYFVSPSLIAPTGHTEAQEPHLIQPSAITLMIIPPNIEYNFFYHLKRHLP